MAYPPYIESAGIGGNNAMLEELPPSPAPRFKPQASSPSSLSSPPVPSSLSAPGDDTMSILGAPSANGEGLGVSADSPTGRALQGVMFMMQGVNLIQSVIPGVIPPPIIMMIQALTTQIPEIVRNMSQMTGPGGMLSTMGANDLNALNPGNPMSSGAGAGAMAGAPMGGGGMPMPMGEGAVPTMPML